MAKHIYSENSKAAVYQIALDIHFTYQSQMFKEKYFTMLEGSSGFQKQKYDFSSLELAWVDTEGNGGTQITFCHEQVLYLIELFFSSSICLPTLITDSASESATTPGMGAATLLGFRL